MATRENAEFCFTQSKLRAGEQELFSLVNGK